MHSARLFLLVALVASFSLSACGSENRPDEERSPRHPAVVDAARAYFDAVAALDGHGACTHMSAALRREIVQTLAGTPGYRGKDCAEIREMFFADYTPEMRRGFSGRIVTRVRVDGRRARVFYRVPGSEVRGAPPTSMAMLRERGAWKVTE